MKSSSLRYNISDASDVLKNLLENQSIQLCNPEFIWNLISKDPDDNKFVDCAIASNSDWIVSNNKHFHVLRDIHFPKVNVVSVEEFIQLLNQ